ncbi:hypothetical protein [Solimonas terrae]|uniref:Secreted protein n=1 Tax=Solimonas terrae TaxID=1396819 RepID=A0A6M2BR43_9GAMM|nr:hypothetical protein [Solimonas terrae]NGY04705.1 hypothetical protein [Solimonas terrae]
MAIVGKNLLLVSVVLAGFAMPTFADDSAGNGSSGSGGSSDDNRSLTQQGADLVQSAGEGTWVQPATDAVANQIRQLDDGNDGN